MREQQTSNVLCSSVNELTRGASEFSWRVVAASVKGPSHEGAGIECQDAFAFSIAEAGVCAVVCDGAGSAKRSGEGARLFAERTTESLGLLISSTPHLSGDTIKNEVILSVEKARSELIADGSSIGDFHSTLVVIVATIKATYMLHVGDGLAAVAPEQDWEKATVSYPENGEYANETYFVTTDTWKKHLRVTEANALSEKGVAILTTDGAMPFTIGENMRGLEPDFLGPITRYAISTPPEDCARALANTIGSERARKISNDDKTIVWVCKVT